MKQRGDAIGNLKSELKRDARDRNDVAVLHLGGSILSAFSPDHLSVICTFSLNLIVNFRL